MMLIIPEILSELLNEFWNEAMFAVDRLKQTVHLILPPEREIIFANDYN